MRRPKGIKTKKSVAKRFKLTATGKVLRHRAGRRHLAQTKNSHRLRRLGKARPGSLPIRNLEVGGDENIIFIGIMRGTATEKSRQQKGNAASTEKSL